MDEWTLFLRQQQSIILIYLDVEGGGYMQFDCFEYKCYIAFNLRIVNIRCRIRFYFLCIFGQLVELNKLMDLSHSLKYII
jgi:hypothetical protein